jgi:hypothetical protein
MLNKKTKGVHMKKTLVLIATAVTLLSAAGAADFQGRLDISGINEGINLTPGLADGGGIANADWLGAPKAKQMVIAQLAATKEWKKGSCTFTPDKDGTLVLALKGAWDKDGKVTWTLFDDIKAEGTEIINGSFENGTAGWRLDGKDQKPSISTDAKEGSKSMKVAHDYSAVQMIKVKANKPVTISFSFKAAE